MRTIFAAASLFAASQALQIGSGVSEGDHMIFLSFMAEQNKDYSNDGQFNLRERIFTKNQRWIEAANKKSMESDDINAVMFAANEFSDMTPLEKAKHLGISKHIAKWLKKLMKSKAAKKFRKRRGRKNDDTESEESASEYSESEESASEYSESEESVSEDSESEESDDGKKREKKKDDRQDNGPVSPTDIDDSDDGGDDSVIPSSADGLDWRSRGVVNDVKNQGSCGSCWAFAAVSQLESMYAIKYGNLLDLSEQQLVDCATNGNNGCNGGFMSYAFDYYTNKNAVALAQGYPYTAKQTNCNTSTSRSRVKTTGTATVVQQWSAEDWKTGLEVSPISIAVAAGNNYFMNYQSGILDVSDCPTSIDHAVVMVGWGQDSTTGKEYWIIRNSWGSKWGEGGYIRIAMKKSGPGVCSSQSIGVTTVLQ